MSKKIALISLVLILALVNWSIWSKEKLLADGRNVYLELAPVDPRSLMQGDYMALRFKLANAVYKALPKTNDTRRWRRDVPGYRSTRGEKFRERQQVRLVCGSQPVEQFEQVLLRAHVSEVLAQACMPLLVIPV